VSTQNCDGFDEIEIDGKLVGYGDIVGDSEVVGELDGLGE